MCQAWCCYFTYVISFNKNYWGCVLHVTRHHSDARYFCYSGGENMDCHGKVSSLHPNTVLTSDVNLCHCLISPSICILICENEIEKGCIYHARDNICKRTLQTRNAMKRFRTWSLLFRVLCACVVGGWTCPWSWHMGRDHTESCLQGP